MRDHSSSAMGPIVIGGNGHSGTRVFCDIVTRGGVFTGLNHLTKRSRSADLKIIDLLNRWVEPFVYDGLSEADAADMRKAFTRRLRICFPFRAHRWGFKNPRTMLILPFLDQLFPTMRFVHVIRDGRDISLGNPFVFSNVYVEKFLAEDERVLPPEEKMILYWGRSNQAAWEYGTRKMGARYLLMRWEDLCANAEPNTGRLLEFARCGTDGAKNIASIVQTPKSMGRWRSYPNDTQERVSARGCKWLAQFGYMSSN